MMNDNPMTMKIVHYICQSLLCKVTDNRGQVFAPRPGFKPHTWKTRIVPLDHWARREKSAEFIGWITVECVRCCLWCVFMRGAQHSDPSLQFTLTHEWQQKRQDCGARWRRVETDATLQGGARNSSRRPPSAHLQARQAADLSAGVTAVLCRRYSYFTTALTGWRPPSSPTGSQPFCWL